MEKIQRVIAWIKSKIDDHRIIGTSSLSNIFTWVDAAYAVSEDMKSQTWGAISIWRGDLHCKSSKQKLNLKSSTEAELSGMSDYVTYNLWLIIFMCEQGYPIKDDVLYETYAKEWQKFVHRKFQARPHKTFLCKGQDW